ncbi:unnamed protein product [Rotaria sordida]|uniref:inorganic diphosphatase n=1 Tax=Rotaria sordida TaxID=392033 RepID=A0A813QRJ3_9BILA|nr:unnamed protein product [Rotaria sordida]
MVFGHRNPDTDSIVTALVFADFLRRSKVNAKAYRLSDLDNETKFVLKTAGIEQPDMLPDNLPDDTEVALVDHNEIGSTATILTKLHIENQLDIDQKTALLLISAIISDTLHFRLPTTTDNDRSVVDYLLPIANIDNIESYANQMFEANSDLSDLSIQQILLHGYKIFLFNNQYWGISMLYTFYPNDIFKRKEELLKEMFNEKKKSHLTGILFSVIDIIKEQNFMIILGEPENTVVRQAFNVDFEGQIVNLGTRISRKRDIIPPLEAYFKIKP